MMYYNIPGKYKIALIISVTVEILVGICICILVAFIPHCIYFLVPIATGIIVIIKKTYNRIIESGELAAEWTALSQEEKDKKKEELKIKTEELLKEYNEKIKKKE